MAKIGKHWSTLHKEGYLRVLNESQLAQEAEIKGLDTSVKVLYSYSGTETINLRWKMYLAIGLLSLTLSTRKLL
jgi:hypothetical protein